MASLLRQRFILIYLQNLGAQAPKKTDNPRNSRNEYILKYMVY